MHFWLLFYTVKLLQVLLSSRTLISPRLRYLLAVERRFAQDVAITLWQYFFHLCGGLLSYAEVHCGFLRAPRARD